MKKVDCKMGYKKGEWGVNLSVMENLYPGNRVFVYSIYVSFLIICYEKLTITVPAKLHTELTLSWLGKVV